VLLTVDGVRLAKYGYSDDIQKEGFSPLEDVTRQFVDNGGQIWRAARAASFAVSAKRTLFQAPGSSLLQVSWNSWPPAPQRMRARPCTNRPRSSVAVYPRPGYGFPTSRADWRRVPAGDAGSAARMREVAREPSTRRAPGRSASAAAGPYGNTEQPCTIGHGIRFKTIT
jgi:hypothetical protein